MVCHSTDCHARFVLCSGEYPVNSSNSGQEENKNPQSVPNSCLCLQPGSASLFNSESMIGSDFLTLKARLWNDDVSTGKSSSVAWQQAQLFRQKVHLLNVSIFLFPR